MESLQRSGMLTIFIAPFHYSTFHGTPSSHRNVIMVGRTLKTFVIIAFVFAEHLPGHLDYQSDLSSTEQVLDLQIFQTIAVYRLSKSTI